MENQKRILVAAIVLVAISALDVVLNIKRLKKELAN